MDKVQVLDKRSGERLGKNAAVYIITEIIQNDEDETGIVIAAPGVHRGGKSRVES